MIGSQVDLEALSIAFFLFSCQIPLRGSHHRPIEKTEHRYDASHDIVDAIILHPKGIEHHAARVQRHRHDQQHPPVQEQGVPGYSLGIDLGGHGFEYDDWAIDLSNLTTNSCGASLCWISGFPLSAAAAGGIIHHRPIIDGQKLLADSLGNRVKTCAGAAGKDDAFHCIVFLFLL